MTSWPRPAPGGRPAPLPSLTQIWKLSPEACEETCLPAPDFEHLVSGRLVLPPWHLQPSLHSATWVSFTKHITVASRTLKINANLLPCFWSSGCAGLLAAPRSRQALSHHRTFALAVPSIWNANPTHNSVHLASFSPIDLCLDFVSYEKPHSHSFLHYFHHSISRYLISFTTPHQW